MADNPVTSVSISGDGVSDGKLALKAGASAQLTATVKPDDATDRKVTWTSSDSSVANVMGTGVVTAGSKAGTATITASAGGQERERHRDGHGRAETADDGVVQAVVVEDREGALQGERQVDGLGPADDPVQGRLVQVHDPGHGRRPGAHGVHGRQGVGQQFRQGLFRVRRQRRRVRRTGHHGRHTKLRSQMMM